MVLNDEGTWPDELVRCLETHLDLFWAWELARTRKSESLSTTQGQELAAGYDRAIDGLRRMLTPYVLHGYHCTRLAEAEIEHILSHGMQLPNRAALCERIERLRAAGLIDDQVADRLKVENQAHEANRAGMIWFCFYPPHIAGQHGIERLLRSWGGEALYNSHERDAVTGRVLGNIGVPCLVEADVPIASFPPHTFPEVHLCRQFLVNRGLRTGESLHHDDRATLPVSAASIRRIIRFPEPDFIALTGCGGWKPPLV